MAFVILSTGALAGSRLHTLRTRTLVLTGICLMLGALAGGAGLGYWAAQAGPAGRLVNGNHSYADRSPADVAGSWFDGSSVGDATRFDPSQPESRAVIDRIGALTGRLIRLESEAATLAKHVGLAPEADETITKQGTEAADTPTEPSGGPLLAPTDLKLADNLLAGAHHDIGHSLSQLEQALQRIDVMVSVVEAATTARSLANMAIPSRYPIEGRRISSGFGNRRDPFTRRLARHSGIDIPAPRGTPIAASAGGRVRFAGYRAAYGNTVEIDHGNGLVTRYAHASKLYVKRGELVLPGQEIAAVGSTGRSTGPHLHFEVIRNGAYVEPRQYLVHKGT